MAQLLASGFWLWLQLAFGFGPTDPKLDPKESLNETFQRP